MQLLFFYICRMSKKWYFGILMTTFTLLIALQRNAVVPNQEIVLEFETVDITSVEAQNTIAFVKKQLQSIGVQNTRLSQDVEAGKLKITYYSEADVEEIKRIFSQDERIAIDHLQLDPHGNNNDAPSDKDARDYSLNVYEIQKSIDTDTGFNGAVIVEIKHAQHGDSNGYSFHALSASNYNDLDRQIRVTQKIYAAIAFAIDRTTRKIPEVRAGPLA